jgi:hypothetical protein
MCNGTSKMLCKGEQGKEIIFEEILAECFPYFIKKINPEVKDSQ